MLFLATIGTEGAPEGFGHAPQLPSQTACVTHTRGPSS